MPRYSTYPVTTKPDGVDQVSLISCFEASAAKFCGLPGTGMATTAVAAVVRAYRWTGSSVKDTVTVMAWPCSALVRV